MGKKNSVTIFVPAFNEKNNLEDSISGCLFAVRKIVKDYEIIIVDDGSTDGTGKIADRITEGNRHVFVIHNGINRGYGYNFKKALKQAKMEYFISFPGDNDTSEKSLREMIRRAGKSDLIISYTVNPQSRSWARQLLSKTFVVMMNVIFGLHLRYFTGSFICQTSTLQGIKLVGNGLALTAEAKIRLIAKKLSYEEMPFEHVCRKSGRSKALNMKSLLETVRTVAILMYDVYISKRL